MSCLSPPDISTDGTDLLAEQSRRKSPKLSPDAHVKKQQVCEHDKMEV
jgi:hypothetical protein